MTIASEQNRSGPYTGNGVTTVFPYDFRILDRTHIKIIRAQGGIETVLTLDSDYTVSGVGDASGGSITMSVAPTALQTITITRDVPFTQETDLENQGPYYAETVEAALDLAVMRDQQLQEQISRALVVPPSAGGAALEDLVANVLRLVDSADAIDVVAESEASINAVAGIAADVSAVADNMAKVTDFRKVYYAPKTTDPAARDDGSPSLKGDFYFNTTTNQLRSFNGTIWQAITDPMANVQAMIDAALQNVIGIGPAINRWITSRFSVRKFYGGSPIASDTFLSGGSLATGRTFVSKVVAHGIRQDGLIRSVELYVSTVGSLTNSIKFKVMRPNGATFDIVSESEFFTPTGTGLQVFNLANPMACQPGDRVGVWVKGPSSTGPTIGAAAGGSCAFTAADAVGGESYTDDASYLCVTFKGVPPFVIVTGDSINEGHNTASPWHSFYDNGPAGQPTSEPFNQIRARIPTLEYQNFAQGGTNSSQTLAKASAIAAAAPRAVVIAVGINDIAQGRTWSQIQSDFNAIKSAMPDGTMIFVAEILPSTAEGNVNAATIRAMNVNYANWCASNGANLILCHDAMAQVRPSTGQLDDLKAAYDYDGTHLTTAGVDALAALYAAGLNSAVWF